MHGYLIDRGFGFNGSDYVKEIEIDIDGRIIEIHYDLSLSIPMLIIRIYDYKYKGSIYEYQLNTLSESAIRDAIESDGAVKNFIKEFKKYQWILSFIDDHNYRYSMDDGLVITDRFDNSICTVCSDGNIFNVTLEYTFDGMLNDEVIGLLNMLGIYSMKHEKKCDLREAIDE